MSRTEELFQRAVATNPPVTSVWQTPVQDGGMAWRRNPPMMYGTAWKGEDTADLVYMAIKTGFRGIDTASMRLHYQEALVGDGIRRAIAEGIVRRQDLYIQTKFTPAANEQHAEHLLVPYRADAPIAEQVATSIETSLHSLVANLGDTTSEPYLDCVLLHGTISWDHLPGDDNEEKERHRVAIAGAAYAELLRHCPHAVRAVGVSNFDKALLMALWPPEGSNGSHLSLPPPAVLQNRFAETESHWGMPERMFCQQRGIVFQGYWILSANRRMWACTGGNQPVYFVEQLADRAGVTYAAAFYALVIGLGVAVLDGTTKVEHMVEDLVGVEKVAAWALGPGRDTFYLALNLLRCSVGGLPWAIPLVTKREFDRAVREGLELP